MTSSVILNRLVAIHDALDRQGLPHAFGGAIALAFHVQDPRATSDIDVNVTADPGDPEVVLRALPDRIRWDADDVDECRRNGQVRVFWREEPVDNPLDIFLPQHPELHQLVVERAERVSLSGRDIPILAATHLLLFKMWYDRRKDWADIEEMLRHGNPDVDEARAWIVRLVGASDERLAKLQTVIDDIG